MAICTGLLLSPIWPAWAQNEVSDFAPEIVRKPVTDRPETARTKDFSTPLYFDVLNKGVRLLPLDFEWDLESSQGRSLDLGVFQFDSRSFFIAAGPLKALEPRLFAKTTDDVAGEWVFVLSYPESIITEGKLEMIGRSGRVYWIQDLSPRVLSSWRSQLQIWRGPERSKPTGSAQSPLFRTQFGLRNFRNEVPQFFQTEEPVRFCVEQRVSPGYTRMCSNYYEVRREGRSVQFVSLRFQPTPARVILQNQEGPLKGRVEFNEEDEPFQFFAELSNGMSFEFFARTQNFQFIEMSLPKKGAREARVVGEGLVPTQAHRMTRAYQPSRLTEILKWQDTIGDFRTFWETSVPLEQPQLFLRGRGGGLFRQKFIVDRLPTEDIRPYLKAESVRGTYTSGSKLFGRSAEKTKLSSNELSLRSTEDEFVWRFKAEDRGDFNISRIKIEADGETFESYYELYKGYPRELSARLSSVVGSAGLVFQGEAALNYWFEDIFGWSNYYLAKQRWGLSGKYFRSVNPLTIASTESEFINATIDLKYRLSPGLWGRDESWGAILGGQQFEFSFFQTNMLGAGVFWARSMPKVFDDILNLFPVMRYPKWVDLEFIYYLAATDPQHELLNPWNQFSGVIGTGNWALNFHGKVQWTKRIFGEAGLGVRQYDLFKERPNQDPRRVRFNYSSFYGTVGLGINF
jgi:hypothetical protein